MQQSIVLERLDDVRPGYSIAYFDLIEVALNVDPQVFRNKVVFQIGGPTRYEQFSALIIYTVYSAINLRRKDVRLVAGEHQVMRIDLAHSANL